MAEDVLRYRVEIDPRQAESELGRLRSGVGSSLTGGPGNFGAGNSIRSDLAYASGLIGSPRPELSVDRLHRSALMMGMEGALGTTAVGSAGFLAAASMFGTGATIGGVGSAMGAGFDVAMAGAPIMWAGARSAAVAAAPHVAAGIASVGSMAAATAINPLTWAAAAATIGVASAERQISDMRSGFDIQDQLTSRGFGLSAARGLSSKIVQSGRSAGLFTGAETAGIFQTGMDAGLFDSKMTDPEALGRKVAETAQTAKRLMRSLNIGLSEAMGAITEANAMGIQVGDTTSFQLGTTASGMASGLGVGVMKQAGAMGASIAAGMGMRGVAGAQIAQQSLVAAGVQASGMDPALLASIGGQQGLAQSMTRGQMNFFNTGVGQMVGMGVLATGNLGQFMSGGMNLSQAAIAGAQQVAAGGATGGMKALLGMDSAKAKMTAAQIDAVNTMTILGVAGDMGLGGSTEGIMNAVAKMHNIDTSTTEGRTIAQATTQAMLDPRARILQLSALQNTRTQVISNSTGVANYIGEGYASIKDSVLKGVVPGFASKTMGAISSVLGVRTAWDKASALGATGVLEGAETTWDATKRMSINLQTSGFGGPLVGAMLADITGSSLEFNGVLGGAGDTEALMKTLGVKDTKELGKIALSGSFYGSMSETEMQAEDVYRNAISKESTTDEKMVNKALGTLINGAEFLGSLDKMTDKQKLLAVVDKAGLGDTPAALASAAAALGKAGVTLKASDMSAEMGTRANVLQGEITTGINNFDYGAIKGDAGKSIASIIRSQGGAPARMRLSTHLAAYLSAQSEDEKVSSYNALLEASGGSLDADARKSITALGANKQAGEQFVKAFRPLATKAAQLLGAGAGNMMGALATSKFFTGDSKQINDLANVLENKRQSTSQEAALNKGANATSEEAVAATLRGISDTAGVQIETLQKITDKLAEMKIGGNSYSLFRSG